MRGLTARPFEIVLAVVGALLLTALTMLRQGHPATPSEPYSSYEAGPDGYRAWYELLVREGAAPRRFERHGAFLDRSTATLIIGDPTDDTYAPKAETGAVGAWVLDGGTLIALGDGAFVKTLIKPAGKPIPRSELRAAGVLDLNPWAGATRIDRRTYGLGRIIHVADASLLENGSIGRGDRARLAWWLTSLRRRDGAIAFDEALHGYVTAEHWWLIVPRSLLVAIALGVLVCLIALAGATIRLGPPVVPRPRREATSLEYVDALASMLAMLGARSKALRDVERSVRRAAARKAGLPDDVEAATLAERLANEDLRRSMLDLHRLCTLPSPDAAAFLRGIALARRLRKELRST